MPWHEIKKHPIHFSLLFVGLAILLIMFFIFSNNHYLQRRTIYLAGGFYFLWSLLYHYQKGDLHFTLVVEYLLMALFAAILLTGTLL